MWGFSRPQVHIRDRNKMQDDQTNESATRLYPQWQASWQKQYLTEANGLPFVGIPCVGDPWSK
jgi:hypothetical protein